MILRDKNNVLILCIIVVAVFFFLAREGVASGQLKSEREECAAFRLHLLGESVHCLCVLAFYACKCLLLLVPNVYCMCSYCLRPVFPNADDPRQLKPAPFASQADHHSMDEAEMVSESDKKKS